MIQTSIVLRFLKKLHSRIVGCRRISIPALEPAKLDRRTYPAGNNLLSNRSIPDGLSVAFAAGERSDGRSGKLQGGFIRLIHSFWWEVKMIRFPGKK
jgi:hypothetical protein